MQTKSLFEGWLRTLLNYAIIPIFVYGLLALLLNIVDMPLTNMKNNISTTSNIMEVIAPFLLVSFVSVLLLAQVMHMASSITGGISLSTMGVFRYSAGRPLQNSAKTLGSYGRTQSERFLSRAIQSGKYSTENKLRNVLPTPKGTK